MNLIRTAMGLQGQFHQLVQEATTPLEGNEPDWMKIMECCDTANLNINNTKEVLKDVKKRAGNSSEAVQNMSLVLLEALFKNGGRSLHQTVAGGEDLLRQVALIASDPKRTESGSVMQARKLILALNLFAHGRRDLRRLTRIVTQQEIEEYRKMCITEDWRKVTGPGAAGIRSDPACYQEISPRGQTEPEVVIRSQPEDQPAEEPQEESVPRPVPPEIQAIWNQLRALKERLEEAEAEGGGVGGDKGAAKSARELQKSKEAVVRAGEVSANPTTLRQLLDLNEALSQVLAEYERLNQIPQILTSRKGTSGELSGLTEEYDVSGDGGIN